MGREKEQNQQYVPKHITVDLQGQSTKRVGESLSSRHQMRVVDENGNAIVGFFTQDTTVNVWGIANARLRELQIPRGFEKLDVIRQHINENPDKINRFINLMDSDSDTQFFLISSMREKMPEVRERVLSDLKDTFDIPDDALNGLNDKAIVDDYLYTVLSSIANAQYVVNDHHVTTERQTRNTNVNRRNNIVSFFAELIGWPVLTANSSPMTVKDGDKVFHGNFMVNAKGISLKSLQDTNKTYGKKNLSISPDGLRQISNLQILDFLCANVDRHAANMFYQVDNSDPDNVVITGVQGIDNDASFGAINGKKVGAADKVYVKMSMIDDIKVIDKDTAKAVLAMKKEDIEKKIRLAGLSMDEVRAAVYRLELLQEKIRSGKGIKIMKSDSDWAKLIKDGKVVDNLDSMVGPESAGYFNIFHAINSEIDKHNKAIQPNLDDELAEILNGPEGDPEFGKIDKGNKDEDIEAVDDSVPTVKADYANEQYALDEYIEFFKHLHSSTEKDFKKFQSTPDEEYKRLDEKMQTVIGWMQERSDELKERSSDDRTLSSSDRYHLIKILGELSEAAFTYAAANDSENAAIGIRLAVNTAKNIKEYASFASESVRDDVKEANMSAAINEIEQIYHAQGKVATKHTFSTLSDRVKGLSGRCTNYYSRMINALGSGDLSGITSTRQKLAKCKEMEDAAKGYLQHKIPNGSEAGLKTKEKARVQFARDILEYAEQNRKYINYQIEQKKDYTSMHGFHKAVDALVQKYKTADAEDKNAVADEILEYGEQFKKGFTNILNVSDKYAKIDDMQAACAFMACGGVAEYMNIYLQCANQKNHTALTNAYEALGMSQDYSRRTKEMVTDGMEQYKNSVKKKDDAPPVVPDVPDVPEVLVPSEQKKTEKLSELLSSGL